MALAALVLGTSFAARPADAMGILRVQQRDGSIQVYRNVTIRIVRAKAMVVTSPDHVGALIISNAACSYVGDLLRCLLDDVKLRQHGATKELSVDDGTLYVNETDGELHLPLSSQGIKPHGVVMAYHTEHGTFVSLHGTIDEAAK
jgi:hypothetical protein